MRAKAEKRNMVITLDVKREHTLEAVAYMALAILTIGVIAIIVNYFLQHRRKIENMKD